MPPLPTVYAIGTLCFRRVRRSVRDVYVLVLNCRGGQLVVASAITRTLSHSPAEQHLHLTYDSCATLTSLNATLDYMYAYLRKHLGYHYQRQDRATRYVSRDLVNCCTTVGTAGTSCTANQQQIEVIELDHYGRRTCNMCAQPRLDRRSPEFLREILLYLEVPEFCLLLTVG